MMAPEDEEFHKHVGEFLKQSGLLEDGWVVGDFYGVAEITDLNASGSTRYAVLILGNVPMHRIHGLIKVGNNLLERQDSYE